MQLVPTVILADLASLSPARNEKATLPVEICWQGGLFVLKYFILTKKVKNMQYTACFLCFS